jgi:hypothetical protein
MGLGLLAAGVVVAGVWAVWFRSDIRAGAGIFTAELERCRSLLEQDLQHVPMEYYEDRTWHRGTAAELHIGGMARLLGGDPRRPQVFSYECLARNGRVINVKAM